MSALQNTDWVAEASRHVLNILRQALVDWFLQVLSMRSTLQDSKIGICHAGLQDVWMSVSYWFPVLDRMFSSYEMASSSYTPRKKASCSPFLGELKPSSLISLLWGNLWSRQNPLGGESSGWRNENVPGTTALFFFSDLLTLSYLAI